MTDQNQTITNKMEDLFLSILRGVILVVLAGSILAAIYFAISGVSDLGAKPKDGSIFQRLVTLVLFVVPSHTSFYLLKANVLFVQQNFTQDALVSITFFPRNLNIFVKDQIRKTFLRNLSVWLSFFWGVDAG